MATFSKQFFSAGANGDPIKVVAVATPGTTFHTAHATDKDELWVWVSNSSGAAVTLTVEWGGVVDPDDLLVKAVSVPANSPPILIAAGIPLSGSKVAAAFASSANVLIITGYVNRIT